MFFEINDLYFTFRIVLLTIGTLGMACSITDFKYSLKKNICIFSLYILYVLAATGILVKLFGYLFFLRASLITISLPGILLVYHLAKDFPGKAVFNYMTQILFSMYFCTTILFVNTRLWNSALIDIVLILLIYPLLVLLEFRFLRRPFLRLSAIVNHGFGNLCLIPCCLLALAVSITFYPVHFVHNPSAMVPYFLLIAATIIIYFTIFRHLSILYHSQLAKHNTEILELQVSNLKERLSENEAAAETARIERHDCRHRFLTIAALLENNDTSTALEYINASLVRLHETNQIRYCSNPVLNAVLSSYLIRAVQEHIQLETHLSIPENLPVDATELSIVFANALENAIHACLSLPEDKRRIIVKCIHKPSLMLEISNPYAGTVLFSKEQLPVTASSGHGIGSRSIAAFCKKYNALCSFQAENQWFTLKVVL